MSSTPSTSRKPSDKDDVNGIGDGGGYAALVANNNFYQTKPDVPTARSARKDRLLNGIYDNQIMILASQSIIAVAIGITAAAQRGTRTTSPFWYITACVVPACAAIRAYMNLHFWTVGMKPRTE